MNRFLLRRLQFLSLRNCPNTKFRSRVFFADWDSSRSSNISSTGALRQACNKSGWNLYVGCTPGSRLEGMAGNTVPIVLGMLLLISLIVNIFQCMRAKRKKKQQECAKGTDNNATATTCATRVPAPGTPEVPEGALVPNSDNNYGDDREGIELRSDIGHTGGLTSPPVGTEMQNDVAVAVVHAPDSTKDT